MRGLQESYRNKGITLSEDPLLLLGLSISQTDTTIVFPSEFGIFDRADIERDALLELQKGLPLNTDAAVVVAAVDRNYVNWVRGGNFNPSGQVRVPSVHGDGIGFFGSLVRRVFNVEVGEPTAETPLCVPRES